jgi:hypothetical protein
MPFDEYKEGGEKQTNIELSRNHLRVIRYLNEQADSNGKNAPIDLYVYDRSSKTEPQVMYLLELSKNKDLNIVIVAENSARHSTSARDSGEINPYFGQKPRYHDLVLDEDSLQAIKDEEERIGKKDMRYLAPPTSKQPKEEEKESSKERLQEMVLEIFNQAKNNAPSNVLKVPGGISDKILNELATVAKKANLLRSCNLSSDLKKVLEVIIRYEKDKFRNEILDKANKNDEMTWVRNQLNGNNRKIVYIHLLPDSVDLTFGDR